MWNTQQPPPTSEEASVQLSHLCLMETESKIQLNILSVLQGAGVWSHAVPGDMITAIMWTMEILGSIC